MQTYPSEATISSDALSIQFPQVEEEFLTKIHGQTSEQASYFLEDFRQKAKTCVDSEKQRATPEAAKRLEKICADIDRMGERKIRNSFEACLLRFANSYAFSCEISFERTLRLPDDGTVYPLPAGVGSFSLRSVDALTDRCPPHWARRGGAVMPMYQCEAMWISFSGSFPCAIRLATGSVNALTGEEDLGELTADPQNYLVRPSQPWIDGFKVDSKTVRQFVAMPVGKGYTVSEQLEPGKSATGLKIEVVPIKAGILAEEAMAAFAPQAVKKVLDELLGPYWIPTPGEISCRRPDEAQFFVCEEVGLAAGGKIRQEIYRDKRGLTAWDQEKALQTEVHICNAIDWTLLTGDLPPYEPITASEYKEYGIPWFDFYRDDLDALEATKKMAAIKSFSDVQIDNGLPSEPIDDIEPQLIMQFGNTRRPDTVRMWSRHENH